MSWNKKLSWPALSRLRGRASRARAGRTWAGSRTRRSSNTKTCLWEDIVPSRSPNAAPLTTTNISPAIMRQNRATRTQLLLYRVNFMSNCKNIVRYYECFMSRNRQNTWCHFYATVCLDCLFFMSRAGKLYESNPRLQLPLATIYVFP